jgi:hypothetical protein
VVHGKGRKERCLPLWNYVKWHMRECLKPTLSDDEYLDEANAARVSPVAKAGSEPGL